jgi:hypothetical protein
VALVFTFNRSEPENFQTVRDFLGVGDGFRILLFDPTLTNDVGKTSIIRSISAGLRRAERCYRDDTFSIRWRSISLATAVL